MNRYAALFLLMVMPMPHAIAQSCDVSKLRDCASKGMEQRNQQYNSSSNTTGLLIQILEEQKKQKEMEAQAQQQRPQTQPPRDQFQSPQTNMQDSITYLTCQGNVESSQDFEVVNNEREGLDISIYYASNTAIVDGNFGCIANFGDLMGDPSCDNPLTVDISQDRIEFSATSEIDNYSASTLLTLNRYSGRLTSNGMVTNSNNPRIWNYFTTKGNFQCEPQQRKF